MATEEATLLLKIKQVGQTALNKTKQALGGIGLKAAAAGSAIVAFVGMSVKAFRGQELAVNKLNQAMVNNGDFTAKASKDMQDFAGELQKTSMFGDETIISMMALSKSFGVSNEEAKKMMVAATNLASATGMTLESAVKNLGKTMGGLTGELGESVPALRNLTVEQLKSGAAIDLVAEKFKGSNEAAVDGLGSITQLKNAFGDLMEAVGARFAPMITLVAKKLLGFTEVVQENSWVIDGFVWGFKAAFKAAAILKSGLVGLGNYIGTTLSTSVSFISALMSGNFTKAGEMVKLGFKEVKNDTVKTGQKLSEELQAIDDMFMAKKITSTEKEKQLLINSEATKASIRAKARQDELEKEREDRNLATEQRLEDFQNETELLLTAEGEREALSLQQRLAAINKKLSAEKDAKNKAKLLNDKEEILEAQRAIRMKKKQEEIDKERLASRKANVDGFVALSKHGGKRAFAIGKKIALAQAITDGYAAINAALKAPPGPPFNLGIVAGVAAQTLGNVNAIQSQQLAEGGLVSATPGGILATIGEGGRDEAVIPLPDDFDPDAPGAGVGGSNITIVVNGGLLGDAQSARELAVALDKELLELRRSNESVSFEDVI